MSDIKGGYAGTVLRVDMSRRKIVKQPLDKERLALYFGGRGADARLLFDELKVDCDPLGPDNILCLSTGALTGLIGPTTGRVNAAAKSPLTDIYGNSNAGTHWGPELKYAGYDSIVVTGHSPKPLYLAIEDDRVELRSADHLWGQGVFDTTRTLEEELGGDAVRVAAVGQAAENGVLYGSIIFDHWDAAGRTGMGTVMASKGLKAVAVRGTGGLEVAEPEAYLRAARDGWLGVVNDPGFRTMATSPWAPPSASTGATTWAGSPPATSPSPLSRAPTPSPASASATPSPPARPPSPPAGPAPRAPTGASVSA